MERKIVSKTIVTWNLEEKSTLFVCFTPRHLIDRYININSHDSKYAKINSYSESFHNGAVEILIIMHTKLCENDTD